jgi:hypothetical protein
LHASFADRFGIRPDGQGIKLVGEV